MRLTIHVIPGSRQPGVGGSRQDALVVRVRERAIHGRATEAALAAVARALQVARRDVALVRGAASRTKVVEVAGEDAQLEGRLQQLLAEG